MYAFLLVLGAVMSAAGMILLASGISLQEHAFDTTNLTPGAIAVIGGFILIGLGFVVRALLRVERALMGRPMPRPARADEPVDAGTVAQSSEAAARIPFPPKPKTAQMAQPAAVAGVPPAAAEAAPPEAGQGSAGERLGSTPVVEDSDVPLLPKAPLRTEEESGEVKHIAAGRNGATQPKSVPQAAIGGRPERAPQQPGKNSIFDSLWPKTQRPAADINTAPAATSSEVAPAPASTTQAAVAGMPPPGALETAAAVSILKSGVVEGMAYTLYSDGSIEAQLPGGTLRFGSITELRNHIEHNG